MENVFERGKFVIAVSDDGVTICYMDKLILNASTLTTDSNIDIKMKMMTEQSTFNSKVVRRFAVDLEKEIKNKKRLKAADIVFAVKGSVSLSNAIEKVEEML